MYTEVHLASQSEKFTLLSVNNIPKEVQWINGFHVESLGQRIVTSSSIIGSILLNLILHTSC